MSSLSFDTVLNTAIVKVNSKWQFALCLSAAGEKCDAPCAPWQFSCANGCCLDPGLECDGTAQCSDGSDEQKCEDCEQWLYKLHKTHTYVLCDVFLQEVLTWIVLCPIICLLVNKDFEILINMPVDEQKGDLHFYLFVPCRFVPYKPSLLHLFQLLTFSTYLFTVRCTQPPDTGTCRDSQTKWYYRPRIQECFRFNYGGCSGNDNRFDTQESCMRVCHGVTGGLFLMFTRYEFNIQMSFSLWQYDSA